MKLPYDNRQALIDMLLFLLRSESEPTPPPELLAYVRSLSDVQLVEQIESVEAVTVAALAHLRVLGGATRLH